MYLNTAHVMLKRRRKLDLIYMYSVYLNFVENLKNRNSDSFKTLFRECNAIILYNGLNHIVWITNLNIIIHDFSKHHSVHNV